MAQRGMRIFIAVAVVGGLTACSNGSVSRVATPRVSMSVSTTIPTKAATVAAINAACQDFYRFEVPEPGQSAPLPDIQKYARGRLRALGVGLSVLERISYEPRAESLRDLVRDNFESARSVYQSVAAMRASQRPEVDERMHTAQRLVVSSAVELINYGAYRCVPSTPTPVEAPGAGSGPLDPKPADAVIDVGSPLLDNNSIAVGADGVWVGISREPSVVRIDPTTNEVVARVKLPGNITQPVRVVDGRVWVSTLSEIVRINPATNRIDWRLNIGALGPTEDASVVSGDVLWKCDRNRVHRVRIATRAQLPVIELPSRCVTLLAGSGHVTVVMYPSADTVTFERRDGESGERLGSFSLPGGRNPSGLLETSAGRVVWDAGGVVTEYDANGAARRRVARAGVQGNQVASSEGGVWFTRQDEQRIVFWDTRANSLREWRAGPGVNALAYGDGVVWASNSDDGTVMRFTAPG